MTDSAIEEEVIAFVADFTHVRAERITPRTTLFGDLGIDGDDGDEILGRFSERFDVDMTAIQPVHFGGEGFVPWAPLTWIYQVWRAKKEKGSTPESRAGLVPITIQDLIESAEAKRWTVAYEKGLTSRQSQRA
jgi:acyl carrier protein